MNLNKRFDKNNCPDACSGCPVIEDCLNKDGDNSKVCGLGQKDICNKHKNGYCKHSKCNDKICPFIAHGTLDVLTVRYPRGIKKTGKVLWGRKAELIDCIYFARFSDDKIVAIALSKKKPKDNVVSCLLFQANFPIIGYVCNDKNALHPYSKNDIKDIWMRYGIMKEWSLRADLSSKLTVPESMTHGGARGRKIYGIRDTKKSHIRILYNIIRQYPDGISKADVLRKARINTFIFSLGIETLLRAGGIEEFKLRRETISSSRIITFYKPILTINERKRAFLAVRS